MIKNKSEKIQSMADAILALKEEISNSIKELPQNTDIKPVAKNCFTIHLSKTDVVDCIDPAYYDFNAQYEALAKMVTSSEPENVVSNLDNALKKGWVQTGSSWGSRIRIHPKVKSNVKGIM